MFTITRRAVLVGGVASTAILAIPGISRAQEPVSTTEVIIAGVQTAIALIELLKGGSDSAKLDQINQKLDQVIGLQTEILNEIQRLKLFVRQELFAAFRRDNEFRLIALNNNYKVLEAGGSRSRNAAQYATLAADVQTTTGILGQYDFAAFPTYVAGVALSLLLARRTRMIAAQIKTLRSQYESALSKWIDTGNPQGLPNTIEAAKNDVTTSTSALNSLPRTYRLWRQPVYSGDDSKSCEATKVLDITGDLNTPFTGATRWTDERCHNVAQEGSIHDRRFYQGNVSLDLRLPSDAAPSTPDYTGIPKSSEGRSEWPQVDDANRLRNETIMQMKRVRDLQWLQGQVSRAAAALA